MKYWKRPVPTDSETYFSCFVCCCFVYYGLVGGSVLWLLGVHIIMASTIHPIPTHPGHRSQKAHLAVKGVDPPGVLVPEGDVVDPVDMGIMWVCIRG